MVKKIQIIIETKPYVPNPDNYPPKSSIDDMAKIDVDQGTDVVDILLDDGFELTYKIVEEDE
jgi:hypothetical protein